MYKFGFIGAGKMGGAILKVVSGAVGGENVIVFDKNTEHCRRITAELGCVFSEDIETVVGKSEYIVLGVKPQNAKEILGGIGDTLKKSYKENKDKSVVLVSMLAGTEISKITEYLGFVWPVIRIMPNIAATVGKAMTLCCANEYVKESELDFFVKSMEKSGRIDIVDEKNIDAYSIVTGCGPAWICQIAEALADGQVAIGVPRDKAYLYAAQTLAGTAELLSREGAVPAVLKDSVCSPGGTTIEGVKALEKGAVRSSVIDAVCAAYKRTKEIGK